MGERYKYKDCGKMHTRPSGKSGRDGCLEFCVNEVTMMPECDACGCHRNFHWKMEVYATTYRREKVYTKCLKIHDFGPRACADGCQQFRPRGDEGSSDALICAVCGCDRDFHAYEIRSSPMP